MRPGAVVALVLDSGSSACASDSADSTPFGVTRCVKWREADRSPAMPLGAGPSNAHVEVCDGGRRGPRVPGRPLEQYDRVIEKMGLAQGGARAGLAR